MLWLTHISALTVDAEVYSKNSDGSNIQVSKLSKN
jgi:hypothetical protein